MDTPLHPISDFGRTLIIANPAAQSGSAADVAGRLKRFLQLYAHDGGAFELKNTEYPRHATQVALGAAGFDTVIALGGDGVIHEVANGLMDIDAGKRPTLGVIPVGSGNDFAQTLGIGDFSGTKLADLLRCERTSFDVGRVEYWMEDVQASPSPHTEYFIETLSVGVDAAIGLGTAGIRKKLPLTGAPLYTLSGLEQFGIRYRDYPAVVGFDGAPVESMRPIIMAIQLGPTYGSGYRICPDADPTEGLFDVCYALGPIPRLVALPMFLLAKNGHHVGAKPVHLRTCASVDLGFASPDYPIQADGERIRATRLHVQIEPGALDVWKPMAPQHLSR